MPAGVEEGQTLRLSGEGDAGLRGGPAGNLYVELDIQAFRHFDKTMTVPVDRTLKEARAESYDALLLPGGALNADGNQAPGPQ